MIHVPVVEEKLTTIFPQIGFQCIPAVNVGKSTVTNVEVVMEHNARNAAQQAILIMTKFMRSEFDRKKIVIAVFAVVNNSSTGIPPSLPWNRK